MTHSDPFPPPPDRPKVPEDPRQRDPKPDSSVEAARIQRHATISASAIGAAASIVAALIAVFATVRGAAADAIGGTLVAQFSKNLPVGTIVPSVLNPRQFLQAAGDDGSFDTKTSVWVPADGRDVAGSQYAKIRSSLIPDLRGMFLRGLNYTEEGRVRADEWSDPDGASRTVGTNQTDSFKSHRHSSEAAGDLKIATGQEHQNHGDMAASWGTDSYGWNRSVNLAIGGSETRPKNIAVFYYIKIN